MRFDVLKPSYADNRRPFVKPRLGAQCNREIDWPSTSFRGSCSLSALNFKRPPRVCVSSRKRLLVPCMARRHLAYTLRRKPGICYMTSSAASCCGPTAKPYAAKNAVSQEPEQACQLGLQYPCQGFPCTPSNVSWQPMQLRCPWRPKLIHQQGGGVFTKSQVFLSP